MTTKTLQEKLRPFWDWLANWRQSPVIPGLAEGDKAKMDYEHRCKRREIWLDKGIFGLVTAVVAIFATLVVNSWMESGRRAETASLERFKLNETRRRFFIEKRLDAITTTVMAMSAVTKVYFDNTIDPKVEKPADVNREYRKAVADAHELINRSEMLLPEDFNKDVTWYYELHRAISRAGIENCGQYRDFVADIETQFGRLCQSLLYDLALK